MSQHPEGIQDVKRENNERDSNLDGGQAIANTSAYGGFHTHFHAALAPL